MVVIASVSTRSAGTAQWLAACWVVIWGLWRGAAWPTPRGCPPRPPLLNWAHDRDVHENDVVVGLTPVIRRVVAARVWDRQLVDDLVQETLARVMSARHRIEDGTLTPYAVATARNLVCAIAQGQDRARRKAHLLMDETPAVPAESDLLQREESSVVGAALARLSPAEREMLLAHEVEGAATAELATRRGTTPGGDRRAAQSQPGQASGRVPARRRWNHSIDGSLPTGALSRCPPEIAAGSRNLIPQDMSWNATVAWC